MPLPFNSTTNASLEVWIDSTGSPGSPRGIGVGNIDVDAAALWLQFVENYVSNLNLSSNTAITGTIGFSFPLFVVVLRL